MRFHCSTRLLLQSFIAVMMICLNYSVAGQYSKIDSIRKVIAQETVDTLKFRHTIALVREVEKLNRVEALVESRDLLNLANQINDRKKKGLANQFLGRNFLASNMNDSALHYLEISNTLYTSTTDSLEIIRNNSNIALAYQRSNQYEEAALMYVKVINSSENVKDYYSAAVASINQASLLMNQSLNNRAIPYLKKVNEYVLKTGNDDPKKSDRIKDLLPNAYINLGQTFHAIAETDSTKVSYQDSAMYYYKKTIEECKRLSNKYSATYVSSYAYNSIGDMYMDQVGKNEGTENNEMRSLLNLASSNYQKALAGFQEISDKRGIVFCSNNLGEISTKLKRYKAALDYFIIALQYAEEIDFLEEKSSIYKNLAKSYYALGDHRGAYEVLQRHISLSDSLMNEQRDAKLQELDTKYQTEVKDREISELAMQNEIKERTQEQQQILFLTALGTTFFLGLLVWTRSRYTQQKEKAEYEQKINTAMSRFVPQEFLSAIGREHILSVQLGDAKENEIAILFTDIRGYTSRSANSTPLETFEFVKEYMGRVGPIIREHKGIINQYLGDGVMALFQNSPQSALLACIEMQRMIGDFNKELMAAGEQPIKVGMGLHNGPLVMGIIGDDTRRDATVISDTVNMAARIESITKVYGADILVSADAVILLDDIEKFLLRSIGKVSVKGKDERLEIYECFNIDSEICQSLKTKTMALFDRGIQALDNNEYADALGIFSEIYHDNPEDLVALHFKEVSELRLVQNNLK